MKQILHFYALKLIMTGACAFALFSLNTSAQIFTRPLPKNWVSKKSSIERKNEFLVGKLYPSPDQKTKAEILHKKVSANQPLQMRYSEKSVTDLMNRISEKYSVNGIRKPNQWVNIYITLDASVPKIVLVFAPAKGDEGEPGKINPPKDLGSYFVIENNMCTEILKGDNDNWCKNYFDYVIDGADGLVSTIDQTDRDNSSGGIYSDTKSEYYAFKDLKEFLIDEPEYQKNHFNNDIWGIEVDFAAYTDKGDANGRFKLRFILQFELLPNINGPDVLYVDDQSNFNRRLKRWIKKYNKAENGKALTQTTKEEREKVGSNNGQLCPPNCPR